MRELENFPVGACEIVRVYQSEGFSAQNVRENILAGSELSSLFNIMCTFRRTGTAQHLGYTLSNVSPNSEVCLRDETLVHEHVLWRNGNTK